MPTVDTARPERPRRRKVISLVTSLVMSGNVAAVGVPSLGHLMVHEKRGQPMRRYLVVAHQTLGSPELRDAMLTRLSEGPSTFHLLVPQRQAGGSMSWSEGERRVVAEAALEEARLDLTGQGFAVTGEVGDVNVAYAVSDVLIREGRDAFDEIIISTLPLGISRWVHLDVPARVERATERPVTHVVAVHASA